MARIGSMALIVLVAGLALAGSASAVSPDVEAMNLQAADVPGAKVAAEQSVTQKGYVAAHVRSFVFAAPNRGPRLISLQSATALAAQAATVATDVAAQEKPFHSQARRKAIVAAIAKDARVKVKAVSLGQLHRIAGYDRGFDIAVSIAGRRGRVYESVAILGLDRVFVQLIEVATHPIGPAVTARYATAIAGHIASELTPVDLAPPALSGTAQQGQTLTASNGSWTAPDASFSYQWQRCDSAGANCADVAGATTQTYAVSAVDVGATLHVVVKATNRFGSATAPSTASAPVV
jgi:hypothetical protein